MIRVLLTKYWVLAHLLVVAGTLCFVPQVSPACALWAAGTLLLFALCLPPVFRGEGFGMARERALQAMRRDVVSWAALLGVLYVGVALFNGPRALVLDLSSVDLTSLRAKPVWTYTPADLPFLPSSVVLAEGAPFFVGLLCGLACAMVIRSVLPRGQRIHALIGLGVLAGAVAPVGIAAAMLMGEAPDFAWLGGAYSASALWLMLFCVALGIVGEAFLESAPKTMAFALVAACLCELGLMAFAGPVVVLVTGVLAVIWVVFAGIAVYAGGRGLALPWCVALMAPIVVAGALGLALAPDGRSLTTLFTDGSFAATLDSFSTQWPFRMDVAGQVLARDPMLGAGPNGFAHFAELILRTADGSSWALWRAGGTALPCDLMWLLVERGLVGGILLLIPGFVMAGRCVMRAVELAQVRRRGLSYRYIFVFVGSLLGVAAMLIASLMGTPLHVPAVLCAFMIVLACLAGWMPRPH